MTSSAAAVVDDAKRPLLEGRGLSKSFEGNLVLADVDLAVLPGEVHAVVGENGAGKSTLIKILGGVYPPDRGALLLDGSEKRLRSPREALANGIVAIHQELSLARHLSTEENIFLGHFPMRLGAIDRGEIRRRTKALLERLSVEVDAERPVGELSIAQQQMVEIAKALSFRGKAPHPRRADRRARPGPRADALSRHRPVARAGHGHRLHLPSPGGDLPDRRPRDRAARRQAHRLGARLATSTRTGSSAG